MTTPPVFT